MNIPSAAGPIMRVSVALLLCAACFQAGRWYQELSTPVHSETIAASRTKPAVEVVEAKSLIGSGHPIGESGDIITPLNVRDPSALVMGPGSYAPSEAATPPPPPQGKDVELEARVRALSQERLLELLRKAKKDDAPKSF